MSQPKIKAAILAIFVSFVATPALALSCMGERGSEQILFTGQVTNVSPADGYISPRTEEKRFAEIERARFQKTSVIDVLVEKVLKGGVSRGSLIQVVIPPGWNGISEGRKVDVKTGAILIGASRGNDGNIWWGDCNPIWQGSAVSDIDWDGDPTDQWEGYRSLLKVWKIARQYDVLLDGRSPAAVPPEVSASIDALLSEIRDFDRILDFYRKRYYVDENQLNGADYAFALLRSGDVATAKELLRSLDGAYGKSHATSTVENSIKLVAGEPANTPLRSLSALSFRNGLIVNGGDFRGQRIVNVQAASFSAAEAIFSGATISNFEAPKGTLVEADFSRARFVGVRFSNPYQGAHPGSYHFDARRASFRNSTVEGLALDGDFTQGDFRNVSGKGLYLNGNFRSANFDNVNIDQISIERADLRGASMRNVRFKNSRLGDVDLRGVNFTGAVFEGKSEWHGVEFDETTIWPHDELPDPLKPRPPLTVLYP
ncbi:pentapeptide repeat-containing protein [Rhizobium sp. MHM7A]|uniref:pentapeptide repeat-containing protein n=1 Tax=Rhizobium sp. MHM7A TaxID=2583233 RepID=UPI001486B273|nr:pentapeptide repeat-containing protein [Rhizobium sp. MHM7A]